MNTHFTMGRFTTRRSLVCLLVLSLSLALSRQARAQGAMDVSVLFQPDTMTGAQGSTLNYTARFTNNTATDLYISNATFTTTDPDFFVTYANNGFFNGNGVGSGAFELFANQSLTVNSVVSLSLDPTVPLGSYAIDSTFTGRNFSDVNDPTISDRDLGTGTLHVIVTPAAAVPEFGTLWSLGVLLLAGGMGVWRQQRWHSASNK